MKLLSHVCSQEKVQAGQLEQLHIVCEAEAV